MDYIPRKMVDFISDRPLMITIFCISLFNFCLYSNTLDAQLVYDDSSAIINNHDLRPHTAWFELLHHDFWGVPMSHSGSHKSYRPLTVATFRLNYAVHGLQPYGYHLINVLLHMSTVTLVLLLAKHIYGGCNFRATLCAVLFSAHPIHTEAVAGVVGRADIMATFMSLLVFYVFVKWRSHNLFPTTALPPGKISLLLCLTGMGVLCKEYAIMALPLCAAYEIVIVNRLKPRELLSVDILKKPTNALWKNVFALMGGTLPLALVRLWIMNFEAPNFSASDNPAASHTDFATRLFTFLHLPIFNLELLLLPNELSFDWGMGAIPLVESPWDFRLWISLSVYALIGCTSVKVWNRSCSLSLNYHCQTLSPVLDKQRSVSPEFDINANRIIKTKKKSNYEHNSNNSNNNNNNNNSYNNNNSNHNNIGCKTCGLDRSGSPVSNQNQNLKNTRRISMSPDLQTNVSQASYDSFLTGLMFIIIPFLPATNFFTYVGFVVAERILYWPSVGFCLIFTTMLYETGLRLESYKKLKYLFRITVLVLVLSWSMRTWQRSNDWLNEESLYKSGFATNPAKAYSNYGNVLSTQQRYKEAEAAYQAALAHRPNMADTLYNLGIAVQEQGRITESVHFYKAAIKSRPKLGVAHLNLGLALWQLGRRTEAMNIFSKCANLNSIGLKDPIAHNNAQTSCLYNLARMHADDRQFGVAVQYYRQAVDRVTVQYSSTCSLYNMLGESLAKLGHYNEAELWYRKALKLKPDHVPAMLTMGHLRLSQKNPVDAQIWFNRAVRTAPNDPSVHYHLAQFYEQTGKIDKAIESLVEAQQLDGSNVQFHIVLMLANLLRQTGRNDEALKAYEQATILEPQNAQARANYGAMLHLQGLHSQAEQEYELALKLNPKDQLCKENLVKLRRVMRK